MATPAAAQGMQPNRNQGLLIAAWVFAFLFSLVGLILSLVGKSRGDPRFTAPMIVSIVLMVLGLLWFFFLGAFVTGM